jgi:hypothetical protein
MHKKKIKMHFKREKFRTEKNPDFKKKMKKKNSANKFLKKLIYKKGEFLYKNHIKNNNYEMTYEINILNITKKMRIFPR